MAAVVTGGRAVVRSRRLVGLGDAGGERELLRAHGDVLEEVERRDVARDLARVQVPRPLALNARRRIVLLLIAMCIGR